MNIYLFGRAGAGKDTVAELLKRRYRYFPVALAAGIKSEFYLWFRRDPTKADRAKLIQIGEGYKTIYGQDVWIKQAWQQAVQFVAEKKALITDGRFQPEYDFFVHEKGFVPVFVDAPDDVRFSRLIDRDGVDQREVLRGREDDLGPAHSHFTIMNYAGLGKLERQVDDLMYFILANNTLGGRNK